MRVCAGCGNDISHQISRAKFCWGCRVKKIDVKINSELKRARRKAVMDLKTIQEFKKKIRRERYKQRKLESPEMAKYLNRRRALKDLYAMTPDDYDRMLNDQEGRCAICRTPQPVGKRLNIDHDHKTGKVRGLLCIKCNVALGLLEHAEKNKEQMENYLKNRIGG